MAKLSLQFHARRGEVRSLVGEWASELGLWVAYETLGPTYSACMAIQRGREECAEFPAEVDRICISIKAIDLCGEPPFGLLARNSDSLSILMGTDTPRVLHESVLQAMTPDVESLRVWRRLRKVITTRFAKGVTVVNSMTGAEGRVENHYYSPGAAAAFQRGVRIVGLSDFIEYRL